MTSRRLRRRPRTEAGYAAILVSVLVPVVFMGLAAISVDVARWYVELARVQKAADAAALGGVTYMPQDLANAQQTAREVAARNGYSNSGTTSVVATEGDRPSQLKVTVSSTIHNTFGALIGLPETTLTRHAIADYTGPAPMGSPCNTFGNEPVGDGETSELTIPVGGAVCPRLPEFWMTVHGPNVFKTQGDEYHTRVCDGNESDCDGDENNEEYSPEGYIMLVRVLPDAVGSPINLEIYDPAYVSTSSTCSSDPQGSFPETGPGWNRQPMNDWNEFTTDGWERYERSAGEFCSGDDENNSLREGGKEATVTSFGLRAPVDTFDPLEADPVPGCAVQYPGYNNEDVHVQKLLSTHEQYDRDLAAVFHHWVDLCTFTPTEAGDYYLQVRTNVELGGDPDDGYGGYRGSGAQKVYTQAGDDLDEDGTGSNRFSVRAISDQADAVSVAGWERMPIFANSDSADPIFNLIRVLPGAAGKNLAFKFFDVGDAASSGTMKVLLPTETTGVTLQNCTGSGKYNGALSNCQVTGIRNSSGWNGQAQIINVPIPTGYTCNFDESGGCWFRVQVSFGSGSVTDATTWTANVTGDPVRLVE